MIAMDLGHAVIGVGAKDHQDDHRNLFDLNFILKYFDTFFNKFDDYLSDLKISKFDNVLFPNYLNENRNTSYFQLFLFTCENIEKFKENIFE